MKYGRAILRDVEGYVPGEQPRREDIIKLNTNENPYPPSPKVLHALRSFPASGLRTYPDPLSIELRQACAARYGYPGPDWVVAGNGMDELLALALRTFVDPGDTVLTTYPSYTLYETLTRLHGAVYTAVELDDAFHPTEAFFSTSARLCFFPRPNAPSGVSVPRETVERLCRESAGIVVIDEAYADFAEDNCMDFPERFDNVIVMRTFSKSYSLAGLRIGIAVARPELIGEFLKTKDSYNLNGLNQAAGIAALSDHGHFEMNVARIRQTRSRLATALEGLGFRVAPSQTNFVLAQWDGVPAAREIFEALGECGIVVRYFDVSRLENALRISVGTEDETDALLAALEEIVK